MRFLYWLTAIVAATTMISFEEVEAFNSLNVLCLVNKERVKRGLYPLAASSALRQIAQIQSNYQASRRTMTHSNPNYASFGARYARVLGRSVWVAENVAYGYTTDSALMKGWMNSAGHRANILNRNPTHSQSAVAYNGRTPYYTQSFAKLGRVINVPVCPKSYRKVRRDVSVSAPVSKPLDSYGRWRKRSLIRRK